MRAIWPAAASSPLSIFLALVVFQGFHELEHVVQVIQRFLLGVSNGNGLVGSLVDIEPVHFVYNTGYLLLLAATYVALALHRHGPTYQGRLVFSLMTFALVFQSWHELEHGFKLAQYLQLGVNGTGGILGRGPGGVLPMFPIPLLHLVYNTIAFVPAFASFVLVSRRGPGRSDPLAAAEWPSRSAGPTSLAAG